VTVCPTQIEYRPLRTPQEDRTALIDPAFDEIGALVEENLQRRTAYDYDVQGRTLADLSRQARRELLREARRWTAAYRDVDSAVDPAGLIFLAGHQPQLFHPGVWLKNFALGYLAGRHGATAVNLLIDSDTVKETTLKVPGGTVDRPQVEAMAFDRHGPMIPYEERRILDRACFADFGRRVAERIASLVPDPLIRTYWPLAQRRLQATDNLGACLAQSRHALEADMGCETLEVPQSRVCDTEPFLWFVAHLLARLPQLRDVYNGAARQYRRVHRIRSTAHPVPDLSADGPWLEAPLWVFSADDPRRRPLFARRRGKEIEISDRQQLQIGLPLSPDGNAAEAVQRLIELRSQGLTIRSRALITTLWARIVLGDLFVHGIGGAKYDHLTDALIEQFFHLQPPRFMIISATLYLPIERRRVTVEHARVIRRQLRELTYHPERYVGPSKDDGKGGAEDPTELVVAKNRWIKTSQTPQNARARYRAIRQINEALQPWVAAQRQELLQRQTQTDRAIQAESLLGWRGYGFCLHREETLREFIAGLLPKSA